MAYAVSVVFLLQSLLQAAAVPPRRGWRKACPHCDYELPAAYAIANGLRGPDQTASYRGEWFDVYSRPIKTRYGEVVNVFNFSRNAFTTVPLPPEIVRRFNGSVMAITGFETHIVEFDASGTEKLVPCTAMYNHHWSHMMLGADAPPLYVDDFQYYDYIGAGAAARSGDWVGPSHEALHMALRSLSARRARQAGSKAQFGGALSWSDDPLDSAPTAHFFSEGNGNEHRLSFHGYARGFAQLIKSPVAFAPGIMFINTKDVVGDGHNGHGSLLPRVALASNKTDYSALLECPCGTRRVMNVANQTIDGRKVGFGCDFDGAGTGVGLPMMKWQNNTACRLETLHGGSKCCENGMVLLDADQRQPEKVSTFYYKQRFFFEDASKDHTNLFRVYWQAELKNNEYDVPTCAPGSAPEQCIFVMTNQGIANETLWPADPTATGGWDRLRWPEDGTGIRLVYAGGHCHVGCISLDLVNLDTGATICHQEPVHGKRVGNLDNAMDEAGYSVSIPPCEWGTDPRDGLPAPVVIRPRDRLQIIAKYNATRMRPLADPTADPATVGIAHHAVMSMFQMRAAFERPTPGFHV
mmetsp:Transcript_62448/g.140797  ORF Transcript_62448/g.140797 Transcript_62448/m.140797 type:complete len:580 (-) Transcript_62448:130-1869(-)|eukprot:CAMPEP_0197924748 /NCGR_PEP_ID=MMETSP1439-20131203/96230_1 /TAXON_ID=66791 /ORGANISM="Gonyaulax spinifera, Strain CCMP409" /LENGTH=579 /DNA_ID=CAMNT_0043547195 /DNA_START=63 /DNA_END=1802 /DNA_ORIENTATION=+